MPGTVRVGRHSLVYGESIFFGANGIAYAQGPVDLVKLLNVPSSEFKEILRPVNQVSGQLQLGSNALIGAYYQFEWEESILPPEGSYLSNSDVAGEGAERAGRFFTSDAALQDFAPVFGFSPTDVVQGTELPAAAVVEAMIAHPAVRRVNFTGSTHVGKLVAATCAKYLKPVVLELGGKAPLVVLDDADIDSAINGAVFGAFANSGQMCMSTELIVVDTSIADDFVVKLSVRASNLPLGDPCLGPVVLGSVVDMSTAQRCNALIEDALAKGAKLVTGGKATNTLMPATLPDRVTPDMRIFREEAFGPVKGIVRVSGVEEAVACANDNEYGLAAAVFGRDIARAMQVAGRIESGICHINGPTMHDEAKMPFGGVKGSGIGRFGGKAGVDAFTELRWMTVQTTARPYPF